MNWIWIGNNFFATYPEFSLLCVVRQRCRCQWKCYCYALRARREKDRDSIYIQKLVNSSIIDSIVCFCLAYILIRVSCIRWIISRVWSTVWYCYTRLSPYIECMCVCWLICCCLLLPMTMIQAIAMPVQIKHVCKYRK